MRREVDAWLKPLIEARDFTTAFVQLRLFKQREMLRIAARDLARLGNVTEITREISSVADVCLDAMYRICRKQCTERFGQPGWLVMSDGRSPRTSSPSASSRTNRSPPRRTSGQ